MPVDAYFRIASIYDGIFEPMIRGSRLHGVRMFAPDRGMRILDVGCGTGIHLEMYREFGCQLYGVDPSPSMLGVARSRLGQDADLRLGSATQMPHEDGTFDLITCMLVLHEMDQQTREAVLAEMRRILGSGGRILLIDYHAGPATPLIGWSIRPIILLSEVAAGRRHFRNYRHFMSIGGLPALIEESGLSVEESNVIAGRNMALYLVRSG